MSSQDKKICSRCGREYPANTEYFHLDGHKPSGLTSWCKQCRREYAKQYWKRPEVKRRQKQYQRFWREANRDYYNLLKREWEAGNREAANRINRRWYWKNKWSQPVNKLHRPAHLVCSKCGQDKPITAQNWPSYSQRITKPVCRDCKGAKK